MHGFMLSIILFDVISDWHSEAGIRCYLMSRRWKNVFIFRRKKNVLPESRKNQYNIYIEKADAIRM